MPTHHSVLTQFARQLRKESTDAEHKLWYLLRDRRFQGRKFRRQVPVGPFIADFVCVEERLIVELDGGQHTEHEERDQARTRYLEAAGYRVVRFWNNEVLGDIDGVLTALTLTLTLTLSRKRERGTPSP